MMRVRLSGQVVRFLKSETAYLRRHSSRASGRLSERMREAQRLLARFPNIGRELEVATRVQARRLVIGDYVLDYQVGAMEILVFNMRHGRQRDPFGTGTDEPYA